MKLSIALAGLLLASATAVQAIPVQWTTASGGNGHWYDVISHRTLGQDAAAHAANQTFMGMTGYLVTITSAAENAFVTSLTSANLNVANPWIGGTDVNSEGTWVHNSGPEQGTAMVYQNWLPGEPNNAAFNEDYIQIASTDGRWNDLFNTAYLNGYVVEYSGVTAVSIPATLPLLATGLGLLALGRRRAMA
ncbi:MAG: lectin-like protein [Pseudomonadota bacterium]